MYKMAVLDDYEGFAESLAHWKKLGPQFHISFFKECPSTTVLKDFDILVGIRERTFFSRDLLLACVKLKHLALTGRLSGQADFKTLQEKGISTSFTKGSGPAPAELSFALMLAALKELPSNASSLKEGGWQKKMGESLEGKTLAILGLGRVGSQVARAAQVFGMKVISWGPTSNSEKAQTLGVERVELSECLRRADVLSVHLRLSEKTKALISSQELSLLKNKALIVNSARAEIFNQEALYSELKSGRLRAALDVFHQEPLPSEDLLRKLDNVLLSPHMGYVTKEVYETFFSEVINNILAWSEGRSYQDALKEKT